MIDEVKELLKQVLELDAIEDDASPENTSNWDSIRHMELLNKLEVKYSLKFDIDEMVEMMSLPAIIEILNKKING